MSTLADEDSQIDSSTKESESLNFGKTISASAVEESLLLEPMSPKSPTSPCSPITPTLPSTRAFSTDESNHDESEDSPGRNTLTTIRGAASVSRNSRSAKNCVDSRLKKYLGTVNLHKILHKQKTCAENTASNAPMVKTCEKDEDNIQPPNIAAAAVEAPVKVETGTSAPQASHTPDWMKIAETPELYEQWESCSEWSSEQLKSMAYATGLPWKKRVELWPRLLEIQDEAIPFREDAEQCMIDEIEKDVHRTFPE